ncbi:MAG: YbhB/YbcL family Raf kinase inhibitor-like protein, partial [Bacteroidales bacterium]
MAINVTTPRFEHGKEIPVKFTCDGDDISPLIRWDNVPKAAVTLALLMDDPDAPGGTFTHWIVYNIPAKDTELEEIIP